MPQYLTDSATLKLAFWREAFYAVGDFDEGFGYGLGH